MPRSTCISLSALLCGLGLSTLAILPGCGKTATLAKKPVIPTVTVATPTRKAVDVYGEYVGQLDSPQTIELRARVLGFIKEIKFNDGSEVNAGDLLFIIDPRPYEVALQEAQAELKTAEAALAQARDVNDIEVNKANLAKAEVTYANAVQFSKDNRAAFAESAVSREALDKALAAEKAAAASIDSSKAVLAQSQADYKTRVEQREAAVAVQKAALATAQLNLDYTRVYAPIAGRIDRSMVKIGSLVGTAGDPTLLATVSQVDPVWTYFSVSEHEAFQIHTLQEQQKFGKSSSGAAALTMTLEDGHVYPHPGELDYISRTVDASTGTLTMRAVFPNPGKFLRPGNYAKIKILLTERPDAIVVPERAIAADQGGRYVLVVNDKSIVERRAITLADRRNGIVVVSDGLKGDEHIVVNGLLKARPGSQVNAVNEKALADGGSAPESQSGAAAKKAD